MLDKENSSQPHELSQSEIDRLLQDFHDAQNTTLVLGSNGARRRLPDEAVQPYDFRQPSFLAPGELRKLRVRHEEFIRSLAARLSIYLRLEVSLQMSKLQTMTYAQFAENVGCPTHLTLFKAEPLKGICLLEIPPRLGLSIVDRLLGGSAQAQSVSRDLTEIEVTLLDQAVQVILNEWCNHWQSCQDLRPVLLGHESNGRFLQTASRETVMFCVAMEARVGDCIEPMQLAFPQYAVEPLVRQLGPYNDPDQQPEPAPAAPPVRWNPELNDVPACIKAEWHGLEFTAGELAALKPGDLVLVDPGIAQEVHVMVASTPKFQARLGTCGKDWAVELSGTLNP